MTFTHKDKLSETVPTNKDKLSETVPTIILGKPIQIMEEYRYLRTIFDNTLGFCSNIEEVLKNCSLGQSCYVIQPSKCA